MKRLLLSLALVVAGSAAHAQPLIEQGSNAPGYTNLTANITASVQTITLVPPARHIVVKTAPSSSAIYVTLDGTTPTSANFEIDGGSSLSMDGLPLVATLKLIGAGSSGTYSVIAW